MVLFSTKKRWAAYVTLCTCHYHVHGFLPPCLTRSASSLAGSSRGPFGGRRDQARCFVPTAHRPPSAARTLKTRVRALTDTFNSEKEFDVFLGELIFSQSDVRDDVLKNLDKAADEGFNKWLDAKIEACKDLDERVGLKSLKDIIVSVKAAVDKAVEEDAAAIEAEEAAKAAQGSAIDAEVVGEKRTNAQVWEEMRRLQRLGVEAIDEDSIGEAQAEAIRQAQMSPFEGLPDKVRAGYEDLLHRLLDRGGGMTMGQAVELNYEQCDVQFLTLLNQKAEAAAGTEMSATLTELGNTVNRVMQARIEKATARLQTILSAGSPPKMEETIQAMAEKGEVDDALVLLLQANLEQAESAGAGPAAKVLKTLASAAQSALDEKMDPEKKLLRQLLRAEDREERLKILSKAFRQRAKVVLSDGAETPEAPEVTPPNFIEVVKKVIQNFGNMGESEVGFADKLDSIISEAEQVATELYGESQTPQDQQDRAWKDRSVSVFDLENMEDDGKLRGEEMPWANDTYDGMSPEMVKNFKKDKEGNIIIGGG